MRMELKNILGVPKVNSAQLPISALSASVPEIASRHQDSAANDAIIRSLVFRDIITTCKAKRARHRELFCGPRSELCSARRLLSPRFVAHLLYDPASALASSPFLFAACKL